MDGLYSVQPANSSDFSRIYEKALENKILVLQPVASGISFKSRDTHAKISIVSDDEKGYLPVSHLIISFSHFIFQRNELIVDHYCQSKGALSRRLRSQYAKNVSVAAASSAYTPPRQDQARQVLVTGRSHYHVATKAGTRGPRCIASPMFTHAHSRVECIPSTPRHPDTHSGRENWARQQRSMHPAGEGTPSPADHKCYALSLSPCHPTLHRTVSPASHPTPIRTSGQHIAQMGETPWTPIDNNAARLRPK